MTPPYLEAKPSLAFKKKKKSPNFPHKTKVSPEKQRMAGRLSELAPGNRNDGKLGKEREIVVVGRKWCGTSGNELTDDVSS